MNLKPLISILERHKRFIVASYLIVLGVGLAYLISQVNRLNNSIVVLGSSVNGLYHSTQVGPDAVASLFDQEKLSNHLTTTDSINYKLNKLDELSTQNDLNRTENHLKTDLGRIDSELSSIDKTLEQVLEILIKYIVK